jgi:O-antigen/teichoic acid export membrane protein
MMAGQTKRGLEMDGSTPMNGQAMQEHSEAASGSKPGVRAKGSFDNVTTKGKLPWAMKGGLAIVDQGLISGSNFVIGILLARWMPSEQYGAYAVALAVLLLLLMLYQSLLMEPLAVFGGSAYRDCIRGYLKALLRLHIATAFLIFVGLCTSAAVAWKLGSTGGLPGALAGVALAAPFILLLALARQTFYLQLSPAPAALGAFFYCTLTLGGLYVSNRLHLLSPLSALLLMGLGSFGASALLLTYRLFHLPPDANVPSLREVWKRHWHYGRWALASAAMMWIPANIFYPLLSGFSGMAQAGELKALMNFATPMLQGYGALFPLLLPYAARVHAREGYAGAHSVMRRITVLSVSAAIVYWTLLLVFKRLAFHLLYSGAYSEVTYLLPVVALGSICWSAFFGPAIALRAIESPASVFGAVLVSSCVALAIGIPSTWAFGIRGAVWCMALSEALASVAALVLFRRKARRAPGMSLISPELAVNG